MRSKLEHIYLPILDLSPMRVSNRGRGKLEGDSASKLEGALLLDTSSSINDSFTGGINLKVTVAVNLKETCLALNLKVPLVWQ